MDKLTRYKGIIHSPQIPLMLLHLSLSGVIWELSNLDIDENSNPLINKQWTHEFFLPHKHYDILAKLGFIVDEPTIYFDDIDLQRLIFYEKLR